MNGPLNQFSAQEYMKKKGGNVVTLLIFLLAFYVLYPVYQVFKHVRPPRFPCRHSAPREDGLVYREVTFASDDGLQLSGWYLPSQNGAAVILVHGYGGNRLAMLPHARMLARHGYGVLLYDMRAHGNSEGRLFALGWDATADVLGALVYLRGRAGINPTRIGALGVSVGGQVVLQAAARADGIHAAVADGPTPATSGDVLPPQSLLGWLYLPMQWIYTKALAWHTGVPVPPPLVELIPRIAPRPVLLISTGRRGEQRLVRKFYEGAGEPKAVWEMPEAHHAEGWLARPEEYAEKMVAFFNGTL